MSDLHRLQYSSQSQHERLAPLSQDVINGAHVPPQIEFLLFEELAKYGSCDFERYFYYLEKKYRSKSNHKYFEDTFLLFNLTKKIKLRFAQNFSDATRDALIDPKMSSQIRRNGGGRLIVFFTTVFNNFYIPNHILTQIFFEAGWDILILKDPKENFHLYGSGGLGSDWITSLSNLKKILSSSLQDVILCGFSSGGYPALFAATKLAPSKVILFSSVTDLSGESVRLPRYCSPKVMARLPKKLCVDLVPLARNAKLKGKIICGELNKSDREHAEHLEVAGNFSAETIPNCGHVSVKPSLIDGTFLNFFK